MTTTDDGGNANDWPGIVGAIVDDARRHAGSGPELAGRLEQLGVGGENGRYSESAISNWTKGRTMPPADALLAAAKSAGISIDQRIGVSTAGAREGRTVTEEPIDRLQLELDRLRADVIDLYGRLGYPLPSHLSAFGESPPGELRRSAG